MTTQTARTIVLTTPLGGDLLACRRMSMTEQLGRLYQIDLELLSKDESIAYDDLLGEPVTVELEHVDGSTRYFNGLVSQFSLVGWDGRFAAYTAQLRPWLWFLTRSANCRIFQEMAVPDIIKEVFRDHGFSDFEDLLTGTYKSWDYCVQYRETAFNFVSRLMEQEGIYYYFKHDAGKHTLVLADSVSAHDPVPGYEEVPYRPAGEQSVSDRDQIFAWSASREIQPGAYVLDDYDFERPDASLLVTTEVTRGHAQAKHEVYDYPGEYLKFGDGESYVQARLEELQTQYERFSGAGDVRGLYSGCLFKLIDHPRADQNREYLVVSTTHTVQADPHETGSGGGEGPTCSCSLLAIDSSTPYRPQRVTPKPVVQGPQTAVVVGKSGEEIWTDKHGRVKVQFHWDREDRDGDTRSCWIRVTQAWAGKGWGGIHVPRIGQEVIVDFLEGDPDRPIVTGRVYNGSNEVPYGLPANATQSGIKSHSSKDGTDDNFNEIRFEDKKGEEQLYIHAEKDQALVVENDRTDQVGNDETREIENDQTLTVGNDRSVDVGNKLTIEAGTEICLTCGQSEIKMKSDGTITIKGMTIKIESSGTLKAKGMQTKVEGTMLDLSGSGIAKLKGGLTQIG